MQRREYIAGGLGVAALLAGGAYVEFGGGGVPDRVPPTEVRTLPVGGGDGQLLTVPATDRATVLDLFTYSCGECRKQIDVLRGVHESMGDRARIVSLHPASFVDDVDDPEPVLDMWADHGGPWPVAIDPNDHFYGRFGKPGVPYTVVLDPDGMVHFSEMGVTSVEAIEAAVRGTEQ